MILIESPLDKIFINRYGHIKNKGLVLILTIEKDIKYRGNWKENDFIQKECLNNSELLYFKKEYKVKSFPVEIFSEEDLKSFIDWFLE